MTITEAQRALAAATEKANAASDARRAAEAALREARSAEDAACAERNAAERTLSALRGRAWLAGHPDDVETVRAGTDWLRLAQLRLGKERTASDWQRTHRFEWNQTGNDVRRALAAEAAKERP